MKLEDTHLLFLILGLAILIIHLTVRKKYQQQESFAIGGGPESDTTTNNTSTETQMSLPATTQITPTSTHLLVQLPQKVTCSADSDCNIVYGQGENKCVNGACQCKKGSGTYCHKCPNHYKNPSDMTPAQIIKFKKQAKLDKMTLEDYRNWLSLFEYDMENLPKVHHENLKRLLEGKKIYGIPVYSQLEELIDSQVGGNPPTTSVTLQIPNSEIDSPLNWDPQSTLNTAGDLDKRGNTEHSLEWAGYVGYGQYRNSPQEKLKKVRSMNATEWFQRGGFPWVFDEPKSGYLYKENRFQNIINQNIAGRQACCEAKKKQQEYLNERRPNVFDEELKTAERVFGPRPNKLPGDLYPYPAKSSGLGVGSSEEGALVRAEQNIPVGSGPQPKTDCSIAGAGTSQLANF